MLQHKKVTHHFLWWIVARVIDNESSHNLLSSNGTDMAKEIWAEYHTFYWKINLMYIIIKDNPRVG